MHVRFCNCLGMQVIEAVNDEILGVLSGILIDPDSGSVEGFFVKASGFLTRHELYCSALDVLRFGTRVVIRDEDALSPAEDRIRLQALLADTRTVIGQRMRTESGHIIGTCRDVQFDTEAMHVEWLFPKRWWKWGIALPLSEVTEITKAAIIVRDLRKPEKETVQQESTLAPLPEISEPGFSSRTSEK